MVATEYSFTIGIIEHIDVISILIEMEWEYQNMESRKPQKRIALAAEMMARPTQNRRMQSCSQGCSYRRWKEPPKVAEFPVRPALRRKMAQAHLAGKG